MGKIVCILSKNFVVLVYKMSVFFVNIGNNYIWEKLNFEQKIYLY